MSTRANLAPNIVIPNPQGSPANGASMAANITSAPTILANLYACSYSVSWSGSSPVGSFSVQASNDFSLLPNGAVNNAGTWNTMTFNYNGSAVTSVAISGNTGNGIFDIFQTGVYAVRLVYTANSGSGTLQAIITGKVA